MSGNNNFEKCARCGRVLDVSSIYLPHLGEIYMKCYGEYAAGVDRIDEEEKSATEHARED